MERPSQEEEQLGFAEIMARRGLGGQGVAFSGSIELSLLWRSPTQNASIRITGVVSEIQYMTKRMWTPARQTSHCKIKCINMELVPPLLL